MFICHSPTPRLVSGPGGQGAVATVQRNIRATCVGENKLIEVLNTTEGDTRHNAQCDEKQHTAMLHNAL